MLPAQQKIRPVTYGLALYILLAPLDSLGLGQVGSALRIAALIPLALMLLELPNMCLRVNSLFIVHILFWFLAMMSLFYSINQSRTISSLSTLSLNYCLVLFLGHMQTYHHAEVVFLKRAMLWSGWFTIGLLFIFADVSDVEGRVTLSFGGKGHDGNALNGYFLYAFSYHCHCFLREKRLWHCLPVIILLGIVLLTGSRGALLAFLLCALVHVFLFIQETQYFVRNFTVLILAVIVLAIAFEWILLQLPDSVSARFSWDYLMEKGTVGRMRIWRHLWERFQYSSFFQMLFGHGYGTTSFVNKINGYVAHNLYLDNLITLGIFGLCSQLLIQGTVALQIAADKEWPAFGAYIGMIGMCMSLSLMTYKPIWNLVILTMAIAYQQDDGNQSGR